MYILLAYDPYEYTVHSIEYAIGVFKTEEDAEKYKKDHKHTSYILREMIQLESED
jgi:hypothetical protein